MLRRLSPLLRAVSVMLVALVAMVGHLLAQSPAEQAALGKWDAVLQAATSTAQLEQVKSANTLGGDVAPFGISMYQLRLAELKGSTTGMQTLLGAMLIDASRHSDWVWPQYMMARAFMILHWQKAQNGIWNGQSDGETLAITSSRFLADVLKKNADFAPARELFFATLLATGERELTVYQRDPLLAELKRPHPDPRALTSWGRVLRTNQQYDSALKTFTRALFAGDDPSRLALERARTLRALNDTASARQSYWDGLERLTPAGRLTYRYDLAWLITADSLKAFDALPDSAVLPWLHAFWDGRDAAAANHFGERLMEHLRRWVVVLSNYRVVEPWRKTDFKRVDVGFETVNNCLGSNSGFFDYLEQMQPSLPGDIRDRERLLDHRGLIYLRHGAPLRELGGSTDSFPDGFGSTGGKLVTDLESMVHNISWLYWIEGEWRLLNFRGSAAIGRTVPSTLSSFLPMGRASWYSAVATQEIPEYYRAAQDLQLYEDPALDTTTLGPKECRTGVRDVVAKSRKDAEVVTHTDSDTPPLIDPWGGVVAMYALGHADQQNGKALITYAIPAMRLSSEDNGEGKQIWKVNSRIVAYDVLTGRHVEIDTLRRFQASLIPGDREFLTGWFEVPLGPGSWQISMRINQQSDSSGMYSMQRHLVVDAEPVLALSDIVPGIEGAPMWLAPDKELFPVNALGAWSKSDGMEIYYEVRGVKTEETYRTTIQLQGSDSTAKPLVTLSSTDRSSGPVTAVRKAIGLRSLSEGRYALTVTVEANGKTARRTTYFVVTK